VTYNFFLRFSIINYRNSDQLHMSRVSVHLGSHLNVGLSSDIAGNARATAIHRNLAMEMQVLASI